MRQINIQKSDTKRRCTFCFFEERHTVKKTFCRPRRIPTSQRPQKFFLFLAIIVTDGYTDIYSPLRKNVKTSSHLIILKFFRFSTPKGCHSRNKNILLTQFYEKKECLKSIKKLCEKWLFVRDTEKEAMYLLQQFFASAPTIFTMFSTSIKINIISN